MREPIREKHFLSYAIDEKAAVNEDRRSIRFVVSSEEVDREREVVTSEAMAAAIKDFADNPVCLAGHQHRLADGMPPVVGSWDTESFKISGKRSEMDLIFAKTVLGETYWQLYKDRHMRAVSIGFRILDAYEEVKNSVRIYIITKIELYEISCVPVGANASALSKLKELGLVDDKASDTSALQRMIDMAFERAVKGILEGSIKKVQAEMLDEIKLLLEDCIGQIKDILIADPDGLAKALRSGSAFDPAGCAADDTGPMETLKKIEQLLAKKGIQNANPN
jgi:HK97 family phage prohead protease